jgi:lipopolysaccharide export system protein LptA
MQFEPQRRKGAKIVEPSSRHNDVSGTIVDAADAPVRDFEIPLRLRAFAVHTEPKPRGLEAVRSIYISALVLLLGIAAAMQPAGAANAPETAKGPVHAGAANPALGQHDSNAPINVASDNFVGNFQTKIGTYLGNVVVTQADYKLRADRVKVTVVNGKPSRFDATGHVVFISTSGVATGDNGIYDLGPRMVTLTGHVVLTKEKDVMHGTMLTVNMVTGESHLTAHGSPGNRVQGLFVQEQQPAAKGGTKPASGASK